MAPRPTIENLRQVGDYQSLFRWNLIFSAKPSGVPGLADTDALNFRCESTDLPKLSDSKMEINIRGHKVYQPGIHNYSGSITLNFAETVDSTIKKFIKAWRDAKWAVRTGQAAAPVSALKGVITLHQLNNQDVAVWEYKLHGVMIEDYELGQLDGQSSDIQRPSMTVSYDYFEDSALA